MARALLTSLPVIWQKYEMWTRLLCWDRKWFYLITHLVKPGVGQPSGWTLQPWKEARKTGEDVDAQKLLGAVYATGIAKYVVKRGRITVPPEQVLLDADMVPAKPEGWIYRDETLATGNENGDVSGILPKAVKAEEGNWNWNVIEAERLRGLRVAQKFAEMDDMHQYFDGGEHGVLGEFADLLY